MMTSNDWTKVSSYKRCLMLYVDSLGEVDQCPRIAVWKRPGLSYHNVYVCNYHRKLIDEEELESEEGGIPA